MNGLFRASPERRFLIREVVREYVKRVLDFPECVGVCVCVQGGGNEHFILLLHCFIQSTAQK